MRDNWTIVVCWRNIDLNIFVIWGVLCCREVPKELTKQELEAQQKKEEEMKKEAKKKEGGLLGFLMQQTSAGKAAEKGGLEFSLANLFKCMCFTHEDPEDSKKQLVNVIVMFSLFALLIGIARVLRLSEPMLVIGRKRAYVSYYLWIWAQAPPVV